MLHFEKLRAYFKESIGDGDWVINAMAIASLRVIEYQIDEFLDEIYLLALLVDPINKDSINDFPKTDDGLPYTTKVGIIIK